MPTTPLTWPGGDGPPRDFLSDLPWFGTTARLKRQFQKALAARPVTDLRLWGDDAATLQGYGLVSAASIACGDWGAVVFIPDDCCSIAFWDYSWDMNDITELTALAHRCALGDAVLDAWIEQWPTLTMGQMVNDVAEERFG